MIALGTARDAEGAGDDPAVLVAMTLDATRPADAVVQVRPHLHQWQAGSIQARYETVLAEDCDAALSHRLAASVCSTCRTSARVL